MSGRVDGVTLSMTRAILDAQEVQVATQRLTQLTELQARETLRIEAEVHLRQARAMGNAARARQATVGRPVGSPEDGPPERRSQGQSRGGAQRDPDATPETLRTAIPMATTVANTSRVDLRL